MKIWEVPYRICGEPKNPGEFNSGDVIQSVYSETVYEVIERENKRGISILRNLFTGSEETWNSNNNRHFIPYVVNTPALSLLL